jgi:hypothetical protein
MDTFGAVFARVRGGDVAGLEAAVREVRGSRPSEGPLGVLAFEAGAHDFALVDRWGRSDDPPGWFESDSDDDADDGRFTPLTRLSALCGEVVAEYSVEMDLCKFVHSRDGEVVRFLEWCEGAWTVVRGEPQTWEAGLFEPAWLEASLENARDGGGDEDEVRAAFAAGHLVQGSRWPTLITAAVSVSGALRERLRLPTYGFQPWPKRADVVKTLAAAK